MAICYKKYKRDRRIGVNILGSPKSSLNKRQGRPGQHGRTPARKITDYCKKIHELQKFSIFYGNLPRGTLKKLVLKALSKPGNTREIFTQLLETRLMSVVYRCGWARTIFHARQLVSHYHVFVNGKNVNVGSYKVRKGDVISLSKEMQDNPDVRSALTLDRTKSTYITANNPFSATFLELPTLACISYPAPMNTSLVIEFLKR